MQHYTPLLDHFFSQTELSFQQTARQWVEAHVMPIVTTHYENGTFPIELIPAMAKQGWLGLTLPEQYGGNEASYRTYGILCQELERGDSGLRSFVSVQNSLAMQAIYQFGSESQKTQFLPAMSRADILGCFALTEPESGSDPSSLQFEAKKTSTGWLVNGHKRWSTSCTLAQIAIMWAKTADGMRGFIVPTNAAGIKVKRISEKGSLRMSESGELYAHNCELPEDALLPLSTVGIRAPLSCLNQARYGICWGAIGAAMFCYETCLEYCKKRKQFGRTLSHNQLVQEKLTNMYSDIVQAQLLNFRLAEIVDSGNFCSSSISLAKRTACRVARKVARNARDLLGANGILLEHHIIRHMMNIESVYTYEGTDHIHTLVVGKSLTGNSAF